MTTLPPTTHALPHSHRAHLIRSTRKLGAVLGETPLLVETPLVVPSRGLHSHSSSISSISSSRSDDSTASKRSGRIFADAHPRSSSLAPVDPKLASDSMPMSNKSSDSHIPRPLLLVRLASPRPASIASPLSPAFPISPMTPTFVVDRRKKMAKLVRTLGTNVPPELVFSAAPKSKEQQIAVPSPVVVPTLLASLSPAHEPIRRRLSDASIASHSLASPTREATISSHAYYASADSDEGWIDLAPSSYPPSPRSPHYTKASPTWNATRFPGGSRAPSPTTPPPRPSTSSRSTDDVRYLSQHFEFSVPARANSPHPHSRSASPSRDYDESASTYRKEQGWSGEWSGAQRMDDVVKSLRGLRMK